MANSTVCQSKWKPIVEPRRAKPKTYRQAPTHWLKFYEETVIESQARTAVFFTEKQGFTGVHIIFLILLKTTDWGHSLEPPRRGGSNDYPKSMFWAEIWKISEFFIWKFPVFGRKIFNIFE